MNIQKINRDDLGSLYNKVCPSWKDTIASLLIAQPFSKNIEVSQELITSAYKEANTEQRKLIGKYFKIIEEIDICKQVSDLNSVYKILGIKEKDYLPYQGRGLSAFEEKMNNIARISKVEECYLQGKSLDWNDTSVYKYYPWFACDSGGWRVASGALCASAGCHGVLAYFHNERLALDAGNKFFYLYKKVYGFK